MPGPGGAGLSANKGKAVTGLPRTEEEEAAGALRMGHL